jgi:hypothetical protein
MGDLGPSSNQAGSGEQFKREEKYISPGGLMFHKQVISERLRQLILIAKNQQVAASLASGFWNAPAFPRSKLTSCMLRGTARPEAHQLFFDRLQTFAS